MAIIFPLIIFEGILFFLYALHLKNDFITANEDAAATISAPFLEAIRKKLMTFELVEDQQGFLAVYSDLKGSIEFASWISQHDNLTGVSFTDESNNILSASAETASPGAFKPADKFSISSFREVNHIVVSVPLVTGDTFQGALNFWFSDKEFVKERLNAQLLSGLVFALSVVLGSFLAWLISAAITKPINILAQDSERISSGELDHQIFIAGGRDEIGLLAENFLLMRNKIKEKIEQLEKRNKQLALEIQERKKTEEDLKSSEAKFRDLAELLPQIIFETDINLQLCYINRRGFEELGYTASNLSKGLNVSEIIHEDDLPLALTHIRGQMSGYTLYGSYECRLIRSDGSDFPCLVYSTAIIDNSKISGLRGIIIDISERKKLEYQLRHSQKMEAIGQLAGGIAHDFNNMLSGIIGAADLLAVHLQDNQKAKKLQNIIQESADRAAALTGKLLTFARRDLPVSSAVDIHTILHDVVSLLESTIDRQIEVKLNLQATSCMVIGDPAQLQNCFLNLCINAVHAMPNGGSITLTSKDIELDQIYCGTSTFKLVPGPYVDIEIKDTGSGILPENLSKIFEPFFTTKKKGQGTGLGLASSYGCVQQHRGSINVYSEVGRGTSFFILLPKADEVLLSAKKEEEVIGGTGRILVVDDEDIMRNTAKAMLEELGYEVELAADGKEGISHFEKNPDSFDLVILDMIMPKMNGLMCFSEMQKIKSDVRVILASGFTREKDLEEMQQKGLRGFIRKPFRTSFLSKIVNKALGEGTNK